MACVLRGSACGPVIVPVFKTGGRRVPPSPVGSTPTRFRHRFCRKTQVTLRTCQFMCRGRHVQEGRASGCETMPGCLPRPGASFRKLFSMPN